MLLKRFLIVLAFLFAPTIALAAPGTALTVNSMATMAGFTSQVMAANPVIWLQSYYANATLGGNFFFWVPAADASGLTPDGYTIISPSNHSGVCAYGCLVVQLQNNTISLNAFGVHFNGNTAGTDDSTGLQAAFTWLYNSCGGTVIAQPGGNFRGNVNVSAPDNTCGQSYFDLNGANWYTATSPTHSALFYVNNSGQSGGYLATGITIKNGYLWGNQLGSGHSALINYLIYNNGSKVYTMDLNMNIAATAAVYCYYCQYEQDWRSIFAAGTSAEDFIVTGLGTSAASNEVEFHSSKLGTALVGIDVIGAATAVRLGDVELQGDTTGLKMSADGGGACPTVYATSLYTELDGTSIDGECITGLVVTGWSDSPASMGTSLKLVFFDLVQITGYVPTSTSGWAIANSNTNETNFIFAGNATPTISGLPGTTQSLVCGITGYGCQIYGASSQGAFIPTDASGEMLSFTSVSGHYTYDANQNLLTVKVAYVYPSASDSNIASFTLPVAVPASSFNNAPGTAMTSATLSTGIVCAPEEGATAAKFLSNTSVANLTNAALSGASVWCTVQYMLK
jgi:hypothetical protein